CGVAGLKPTFGRVSRAGHILPPGCGAGGRTHVGPMARFVEDLVLALSIISGSDPKDPEAKAAACEDPGTVYLPALRVGFFTETRKGRATSEMVQAVRLAAETLRAAGLKCEPTRPPGVDTAAELLGALNSGDGGEDYQQLLRQYGTTNLHPQT